MVSAQVCETKSYEKRQGGVMLHTYRSSGWRLARQKVLLSLETYFRWKLFNSRSYFDFRKLFVKAKRPKTYDTLSFQSISKLYICILKSSCCILLTTVESFYSVKYGLSIIMLNVCQIISVIKTKTLVFPEKWYFKNSSFCHFNSCFVFKHLLWITGKKHKLKINNYLTE